MVLQVNQNSSAPASATSPDGSAAFPLQITGPVTLPGGVPPLPTGATALANSSGNVAAAAATATLTSAASRTAYISGFEFMGFGQTTSTSIVTVTVIGLLGGTLTYFVFSPTGAGVAGSPFPLAVEFNPPLPASAVNTNIVASAGSMGVGSTNAVMNVHGYLI